MRQKKCYSCAYVQRPENRENMHCNYSAVTGKTRVKQVYEKLGIDRMTDEAREMLSGYSCPFYIRGEGKTPDAERIRRIESEREKKEQRRKRIQDELMGRVPKKVKKPQSKFNWEEAARLYEEGKSATEIARALGCSRATVQNWKHETGRSDPTRGAKPQYDWGLARLMWEEGSTTEEIARTLGCGRTAVEMWKKREGLQRKQKRATPVDSL